jgi:excisionase family DNA binding protein
MSHAKDRLLSSQEVGRLLKVTRTSIWKWIKEGRLPAYRTPGGHHRVRATDLAQFLRRNSVEHTPEVGQFLNEVGPTESGVLSLNPSATPEA